MNPFQITLLCVTMQSNKNLKTLILGNNSAFSVKNNHKSNSHKKGTNILNKEMQAHVLCQCLKQHSSLRELNLCLNIIFFSFNLMNHLIELIKKKVIAAWEMIQEDIFLIFSNKTRH